jgi:hypothetical protein
VKKAFDFLGRLIFEGCSFAAVHDTLTDGLSVADFFEEKAMLAHTWNAWMMSVHVL